ncbi:phosphoserine phosphatase SerB [Lactococcus nasutitermitis]|uniref:phosphoserine phosphatase n=1 Tax=Lactococcus nasutitermitis TaxID=1652957 RepID=A0ABV9JC54_9LACT|nr:phosphoserine phosphatase SerB [Lactococcus nasutitermitis]
MTEKVKKLLVMDVDSTLIEEEVIDLLGDEAGVGEKIAQVTAAAMRGEIDFKEALAERVALLAGLPESIFARVYAHIHLTKGARELIDEAHKRGWKVGVVSGGFHEIVDIIAHDVELDYVLANRLALENGKLTGKTRGQIIDKTVKLETIKKWAAENELDLSNVIALGDGANDIPMIQAAGIGIAFCAKPMVQAAAPHVLNKRDLLKVLEIVDKQ